MRQSRAERNQVDKRLRAGDLYEWVEMIVMALVSVMIVFTFIFRVVTISGPSMIPTLRDGQRVVVSNLFYTPKVGDVVVFSLREQSEPYIKRVIAVEGQTVDFNQVTRKLIVDGVEFAEPYINEAMLNYKEWYDPDYYPITVGEGQYFVCGDNRNHSYDSRYPSMGLVDAEEIVGHALFIIFPFTQIGGV